MWVKDEIQKVFFTLSEAKCLQEDRDGLLTLAVNAHVYNVFFIYLKLEPCTATRNHFGSNGIFLWLQFVGLDAEVNARRTY